MEDIGFAKLDLERQTRKGFGEAVFGECKTSKQLVEIFSVFQKNGRNAIATRVDKDKASEVIENFPMACYQENARVLTLVSEPIQRVGEVAICTGGTGDIPVAEEAAVVAQFYGSNVSRYYDVGVAGIHRLMNKIDDIKRANVIIAVAGMEGALGSVITGLCDVPVIAVPTSVGYGTSLNGVCALLTMLNSCAEGMTVVNIDNGFGAGYSANLINTMIEKRGR